MATRHGRHDVDRARIEPANGVVQDHAAVHVDAGHHLGDQRGPVRSHGNVVLEHDRAHTPARDELGHLDIRNVAGEGVGRRVDVEIDRALDRIAGFERRLRKRRRRARNGDPTAGQGHGQCRAGSHGCPP
jgi:hypothetical protein